MSSFRRCFTNLPSKSVKIYTKMSQETFIFHPGRPIYSPLVWYSQTKLVVKKENWWICWINCVIKKIIIYPLGDVNPSWSKTTVVVHIGFGILTQSGRRGGRIKWQNNNVRFTWSEYCTQTIQITQECQVMHKFCWSSIIAWKCAM